MVARPQPPSVSLIAQVPVRAAGFTLVELIVVVLLLGIVAVFVAPRMNITGYREQGFYQQAQAAVRLTQKLAISSGCVTRVQISSSGCTVTWNVCAPASGTSIPNPGTGNNDYCTDSDGTVGGSADISFDAIGRPVNSGAPTTPLATTDISINGRTLRVEAETGYAHEP